ncbi:hypothetical protein NJL15_001770 [Campylobacter coli]|nr:hypothetical protein [Campylobacter coli]EIE1777972.1 hypothetical protein [Campylobacter jejuni]EAI1067426.1 hypothetical protein [Campylobacter coli]EAJ6318610.1 hypothetical protein [Campylobacter coli]EAL2174074.1 hypothetical protein [Campylobacter coli]
MKFKILFFLPVFLFSDYNASKITLKDLENLQNIEGSIYEKSMKNHQFEISNLVNLIWENRAIKIQPILERFNLSIAGFAGEKSKISYYEVSNKYENLQPYAYIGLQAEFKIIDPKEARQKKDEIRKQRILISKMVRDFQAKKLEIFHLKNEISILHEKENRLKIRVNEAVSNFDERLKNLEDLQQKNSKLDFAILDLSQLENDLIDLVNDDFKPNLKRILR